MAVDPDVWPWVIRVRTVETEGLTAAGSAQQLYASSEGEAGRIWSPPPAGEPAGQQSVREAPLAQASAGWTMPRRHATSTSEAVSRRTINDISEAHTLSNR
jgi:hypothetical protein